MRWVAITALTLFANAALANQETKMEAKAPPNPVGFTAADIEMDPIVEQFSAEANSKSYQGAYRSLAMWFVRNKPKDARRDEALRLLLQAHDAAGPEPQ